MSARATGRPVPRPLFPLGQVVATPAALIVLNEAGADVLSLLTRHAWGDWSDMCEEDQAQNRRAVEVGSRVFSSYRVGERKIWIITEADRSSTCVLTPGDY
jgi:hypothetical protein